VVRFFVLPRAVLFLAVVFPLVASELVPERGERQGPEQGHEQECVRPRRRERGAIAHLLSHRLYFVQMRESKSVRTPEKIQ